MAFHEVCKLDDLWQGEMAAFEVDGHDVLVVHTEGGEVRAYPGVCPHQDHPLVDGVLADGVLTCSAHLWQFDVETGEGVNPKDCALLKLPVKVDNDTIFVDAGLMSELN